MERHQLNDSVKLEILESKLIGSASEFYGYSTTKVSSYDALPELMQNRFGSRITSQLRRTELLTIKQQAEENLVEFSSRVAFIAGEGYTDIQDGIEPSEGDIAFSSSITKLYWLNRNLIQMDNSILYYEWITEQNSKLLLVVPHSLQEELMQESHDKITAGHLGAHKMLIRLREHFFWRGMGKACQLYVETCHTCTKQKKLQTKQKAALCNYHAGNPMDMVHIDILGPFPVSDNGNRYILMLVDQFTKWLEAYPLPDQTAVTVARAVVDNFISRFGCPLVIHTDQGRNFESDLFKAVCTLLEISKTRTTPTHPCSNGQVERYNRTLLGLIRCHVAEGKHNWDELVPLMAGAICSMQNRHTGQTANMMMLGREVRRPLSVVLDDSMSAEHSNSEYIRKLLQNFRDVHNNA